MDLSLLFTNLALYNPLKFADHESWHLSGLLVEKSHSMQFDCYCIECGKDSTFKNEVKFRGFSPGETLSMPSDEQVTKKLNSLSSSAYHLYFNCQREETHVYHFSFKFKDSSITKIGQYPSEADIQSASIKKYQNVLKKDYRDFSKALGLYSHGIGIGSFVYVRRIFENLVEEKRIEASKEPDWDNDKFMHSKMDEKIKLLRDRLPSVLVDNRQLYSIVSKGIHELNEEDCLSLFPDLQIAIELILDEKIYLQEQQRKISSVRHFVSKTVESFKK